MAKVRRRWEERKERGRRKEEGGRSAVPSLRRLTDFRKLKPRKLKIMTIRDR